MKVDVSVKKCLGKRINSVTCKKCFLKNGFKSPSLSSSRTAKADWYSKSSVEVHNTSSFNENVRKGSTDNIKFPRDDRVLTERVLFLKGELKANFNYFLY